VVGWLIPVPVAMLIMDVAGNLMLQICSRLVSARRGLLTFAKTSREGDIDTKAFCINPRNETHTVVIVPLCHDLVVSPLDHLDHRQSVERPSRLWYTASVG